jgi:spermidine/putrescine transport system substrate-binding protein
MVRNKHDRSSTQPSKPNRRTVLTGGVATLGLAAAASVAPTVITRAQETTLNWLTWAGHSDPYVIEPFEKATGIKIRAKEYAAGDLGLVELTQNPGLYDIVSVSGEFIPEFVASGTLQEVDPEEFAGWKEYLPEFKKDLGWNVDGKFHSILYEFGFNGLSYRTDKLSEEDLSSYEIIRDPRLTGKVASNDWWGNAMGSLSILSGNAPIKGRNPYVITDEEFGKLRQTMAEIRPQFSGFLEYAGLFSGFANGSIWLQPGGGDWATQILVDQGVPVATSIPREGGYLWGELISIVEGTTKLEAAKQFVDYCLSAEAQARFATKPAYTAICANQKGWEVMQRDMPKWAERLQMASFDDPNAITAWRDGRIVIRRLPVDQTVTEWADLWQEFKNM